MSRHWGSHRSFSSSFRRRWKNCARPRRSRCCWASRTSPSRYRMPTGSMCWSMRGSSGKATPGVLPRKPVPAISEIEIVSRAARRYGYGKIIGEAQMARRLIDISVPLQNDVPADPPGLHPTIVYIDHQQGLPRMLQFFEGLKAEDLPDGQGWAVEQVSLSTHNGTHLDAPWHFHPTMNRGERSWTIDEVPLELCLQPAVKLDFRHLPDGYVTTARDVENELKRIGHTLSPLEIVVVNTSAGAKYGRPDFVTSGCGMGYEATMYLLERGVRLTGIDGWSWDAPFVYTAKKFAETGDASLIWEGHKAGQNIGYLQ